MCDEACAASQKEFELIKFAKGGSTREIRVFKKKLEIARGKT